MPGFRRKEVGGRAVPMAVIVVTTIVATIPAAIFIQWNPLSFDGGMNGQAAYNLMSNGSYGIAYGNGQPFDHRLQTGPTVILPIVAAYALAGVSATTTQIPSLLYFVVFFILAASFAHRHAGWFAAAIAILLLMQNPFTLGYGLGAYGEVPALTFFLAALLVADGRKPSSPVLRSATIGFLLGLTVLTKIVMVIPATAAVLVFFLSRSPLTGSRFIGRASLFAGAVLPYLVFELVKLIVLSPATVAEWWGVMLKRTAGQAFPGMMQDTPSLGAKLIVHLDILAHGIGAPTWTVIVLIMVPTILLLFVWWRGREKATGNPVTPTVAALWLAATAHLGWWLALTPTSRAVMRRALPGLALQELLAGIAVALTAAWVTQALRDPARRAEWLRRPWIVTASLLGAALIVAIAILAVRNLPPDLVRPDTNRRRVGNEKIAAIIRSLPENSEFYTRGWFQAPVISLLAERSMRDINEFPVTRYDEPLDSTYFVGDQFAKRHESENIGWVVERSDNELVAAAGGSCLLRLTRVHPYPPPPLPRDPSELAAVYRPRESAYPFVGGLSRMAPGGRLSGAVSGVILDAKNHECLVVDLWVSEKAGPEPKIEVRLDGTTLFETTVRPNALWRREFRLAPAEVTSGVSRMLQLRLHRRATRARFSLWSSAPDLFVVREVGFVPCSEPALGGQAASHGIEGVTDPRTRVGPG